jgi:D-alanine-D-alanine ligase-like ATP-grasp enzyme|tara:strand:+ start:1429 stop:1701 length:273 start_codon:yes stop_codon:yes gene_type:complete
MIEYKYKKKENKFTENGHTMFEEDVLQRLKRLADLEEQIKQGQLLPLDSVSQQRELLLDFANKYWNPQENPDNFIKEEYIDDYLKSNNCG